MATKTAIKMKQLENLTSSRALVTGTDGKIDAAATTSAEVGYLASANATLQNGKVLVPNGSAVDMNSITQTNVDIDSGAIDGTPVGANAASSGAFTTLSASGNVDLGDATSDTITMTGRLDSSLEPSTDNARNLGDPARRFAQGHINELHADSLGQALDANSQAITNVNIDSGNIDGVVIGSASAAAGTFTDLVASGNVDLGDAASDSVTVTGRFDSDLLPIADSASDLGSSSLQWAELHVDAGYIDQLGAPLDANNQAITNIDVDSGAIDGTAIGANSASSGAFTTLSASTSITFDGRTLTNITTSSETFGNSDDKLVTEAAVKKHIEAHSEGLDVKESVVAASTAGLSAFEYKRQKDGSAYNVADGTAAKDVGHINKKDVGWLVLDNYLITKVGERVLIKDGVDTSGNAGFDGEANGIYESTIVGGIAGNSKLEFVALTDTISEALGSRIEFRARADGNDDTSSIIDAVINFRSSASASASAFTSGGGGAPYELDLTVDGSGALANRDALMNQIRTAFGSAPFSNYTVSALATGSGNQDRTAHTDGGNASFSVTSQASSSDADFEITYRDLGKDYLQIAAFPYVATAARPVIKRASDADGVDADGTIYSAGEKTDFNPGMFMFIEQGKDLADCGFVYVGDDIVEHQNEFLTPEFVQFSSKGVIGAGRGLRKDGNEIREDLDSLTEIGNSADLQLGSSAAHDKIAIIDGSDSGQAKKVKFSTLMGAQVNGGEGIAVVNDRFALDINGVTDTQAIADTDLILHTPSGTSGAKQSNTRDLLDVYVNGSSEFSRTGGILTLDNGGVALTKLASISAGQILVGPSGNGSPAAVAMSGDIAIDDAGATTIQANAVEGTMLNTNVADASTIEVSSNTLSVLQVPNNLTAGSGLEFASGSDFNGSAARELRLEAGGIAQDSISHLVGFCKVTTSIAALNGNSQNVIETSDLVINSNSQLDQLHKLAHPDYAAQSGTDQRTAVVSLNAAMTARVYLNGMLLFPEVGGDDTTTFANVSGSDIADYKFVANDPGGAAEDVQIIFNGALLEDGDLIQIEAIARV